jgi:rare lipoprotein A
VVVVKLDSGVRPAVRGGRGATGIQLHTILSYLLALTLAACSTTPRPAIEVPDTPPARAVAPAHSYEATSEAQRTSARSDKLEDKLIQEGVCSWYGPRFHGRKTSNGERFDQNKLTAAHPSLPFGSRVEVTDLDSGRKVVVRINDRGPYAHGRIIDLSRAAASQLGILAKGTANVEIRLLDDHYDAWPEPRYAVQVGAYKYAERAQKRIDQLLKRDQLGGPFYVREPDARSPMYRVRVGPFRGYSLATAEAQTMRSIGLSGLVVEEDLRAREQFGEVRSDAIVQAFGPTVFEELATSQAR